MSIDKIETVRTLLKYTGDDNNQRDAVIRGAIAILEGALSEIVPKPSKVAPKPATNPKTTSTEPKRKPFDKGKLRALREGSWSVIKIADEMGVSEQTIRNHMKKEGIV